MPPDLPSPPPGAAEDLRSVVAAASARGRAIELEIGSGKGVFIVRAAALWPERELVAVEQVGSLARKIASKAARAGLENVTVLRCGARQALEQCPEGALSRVHVYFPDPWPKRRHAKHRLFAGDFADLLARALARSGELCLATDHDPYFREVVATLRAHAGFVRTLPDSFSELPRGGFDAIFERAGVPALRGTWERRASGP